MKITRDTLKEIVKECLVEILAEGILSTTESSNKGSSVEKMTEMLGEARSSSPRKLNPSPRRGPPKFDPELDRPIAQLATLAAGKDTAMAALLADTAKTTLMSQNEADSHGGGLALDGAARMSASIDNPEEMFGSAAKNWATLAFAPGPKGPLGGNS